jgi:hypothetical protein
MTSGQWVDRRPLFGFRLVGQRPMDSSRLSSMAPELVFQRARNYVSGSLLVLSTGTQVRPRFSAHHCEFLIVVKHVTFPGGDRMSPSPLFRVSRMELDR